jgi:hypothetical protein
MAIIRSSRPENNFYILDKKISEDKRLSWGARGLLVYLLGKPDHWQVSTASLINATAEARIHSGRDAVRAFLSELISIGYMTRTPARDENGKIAGYDYFVSEICTPPETDYPGTAPETDYPAPAEPAPANPRQVSTDFKQGLRESVSIDGASAPPACPAEAVDHEPPKPTAEQAALEATPDAIAEEAPRVRSKSVDFLMAKGVEYQVAVDWMVARKTKQVTPTVWSLVIEEAEKAGITAVEAVKWAAARGYANFQADWYTPETQKAPVGAPKGYTKFPAKPNLMDENRAAAAAYLAERNAKMGQAVKDMGEVEQVAPQQTDFLDDNWHPA